VDHTHYIAAALFCAVSATAHAAETNPYPSRPIRLVAPFAPGGGTDVVSRLVAQRLIESWGQPVILDNRPGAGTMIGTEIVKNAPPDGYTILICAAAHSINPSLYSKVNYHPVRDFAPITMAVTFPFLLVVHPSVPAKNVQELVAAAKAQPGKLTFASSGSGNTNHLAGELLKITAAIDITHVPYKGGAPALNDVVGGQVSMMFGTVVETLPQARAGKVRAIGVTSAKRAAFAPDVPAVAETLRGFEVIGWYAFLVPAGTPAPVVDKLNREVTRILETPDVKQKLVALGTDPSPMSSQETREFIARETVRWEKVVKQSGLRAD
jgi:tripartite-type tricarboxylate transporter receptor subunit TctC